MSKLLVTTGTFGSDTLESNNLTIQGLKYPEIDSMLLELENQYSVTYLIAGSGRTIKIPAEKLIGNVAYEHFIQGRLIKPADISAITAGDGTASFTLTVSQNFWNKGDLIRFSSGYVARIMEEPTGAAGAYSYKLQSPTGTAFTFAVHAPLLNGARIASPIGSSHPEGSEKGFENNSFPDKFVNHLTIYRKSLSITGSMLTDVTWIQPTAGTNKTKGWIYTAEHQFDRRVGEEMERLRMYGLSSWKDSTGTLLSAPNLVDPDTGRIVSQGDGLREQVRAVNQISIAGTDPTEDNFRDMMSTLSLRANNYEDNHWVAICGNQALQNFEKVMRDYVINGGVIFASPGGQGKELQIGHLFRSYWSNGNKITLMRHPNYDDETLHSARDTNGKLLESSRITFMDMGIQGGRSNVEIMVKGADGINRSMVRGYVNGIHSLNGGVSVSQRDGVEKYNLTESMISVRNVTSCGEIVRLS